MSIFIKLEEWRKHEERSRVIEAEERRLAEVVADPEWCRQMEALDDEGLRFVLEEGPAMNARLVGLMTKPRDDGGQR